MNANDQGDRERVRAIRCAVEHIDVLLSSEWRRHGHTQHYDDLDQRRRRLLVEVEASNLRPLRPWCGSW